MYPGTEYPAQNPAALPLMGPIPSGPVPSPLGMSHLLPQEYSLGLPKLSYPTRIALSPAASPCPARIGQAARHEEFPIVKRAVRECPEYLFGVPGHKRDDPYPPHFEILRKPAGNRSAYHDTDTHLLQSHRDALRRGALDADFLPRHRFPFSHVDEKETAGEIEGRAHASAPYPNRNSTHVQNILQETCQVMNRRNPPVL